MSEVRSLFDAALAAHRHDRLDEAERLYRKLLKLEPRHSDTWHLLGLLAHQEERLAEALEYLDRAVEFAPPSATLEVHRGNVLRSQGDHAAAAAYRRAIAVDNNHPGAHLNLASLLEEQGDLHGAIDEYRIAVRLAPTAADLHNQLGNLHERVGELTAATECYECAIALDPGCGEAHFNLGTVRGKQGRFEEAIAAYSAMARLRPEFPDVFNRLGEAHLTQGRGEEAEACYRKAIALQPEEFLWQLRLDGMAPSVFRSTAEIDQFRGDLEQKLRAQHDRSWKLELDAIPASGGKPPVGLAYHGRDDLPLKRLYAELVGPKVPRSTLERRSGKPHLALLVTEGHEGIFLRGMAGILNRLDTGALRVTVACPASATQAIARAVRNEGVEQLRLAPRFGQAVEQLRSASFDMLYFWEIGTDCVNYYLPYFRTAPVQATSWGWPVTSGIPEVDYFISSRMLEPPVAAKHYSEQLVELAHIPNCYDRPQEVPARDREHFGLPVAANLYLCAQTIRKIHPEFDALLRGILEADGRGEVLVVAAAQAAQTELLASRLARTLGGLMDRVRFVPRLGRDDYRRLMATADVALDTLHYGGGANTTYDALAAGTPVVTLPGEYHRGRYAAGVYRQMGLPELIAASCEDYIAQAVELAANRDRREAVSRSIIERLELIFEHPAPAQEFQEFVLEAIARSRADNYAAAQLAA